MDSIIKRHYSVWNQFWMHLISFLYAHNKGKSFYKEGGKKSFWKGGRQNYQRMFPGGNLQTKICLVAKTRRRRFPMWKRIPKSPLQHCWAIFQYSFLRLFHTPTPQKKKTKETTHTHTQTQSLTLNQMGALFGCLELKTKQKYLRQDEKTMHFQTMWVSTLNSLRKSSLISP